MKPGTDLEGLHLEGLVEEVEGDLGRQRGDVLHRDLSLVAVRAAETTQGNRHIQHVTGLHVVTPRLKHSNG